MTATIHHGECIETMRTMRADSIDAIVTDPPYGLGFMGKAWDDLPPGKEWAQECYRILKPGGHILAFGGSRTWHRLAVAIEDSGFEIRDSIAWLYGTGFPKHRAALKPAFEPIVMGRKPYKGTLLTNEAEHGTGALNIEENRIGTGGHLQWSKPRGIGYHGGGSDDRTANAEAAPHGRWPANVILDEHTAELLDEQSGSLTSGKMKAGTPRQNTSGWAGAMPAKTGAETTGDTGGASRFFYIAKAPKSERPNIDGITHTTVKPLTLMRHLIRLVTPPGGTILDPFAGSGTTIEAAILEGYNSIGIERETEYLPLIQHRIDRATP